MYENTLQNQNTRCWNEIIVLVETLSIVRIRFGYLKKPFYLTINRLSLFKFINLLKHIQNIHKVKWIWKHWGTFWKVFRLPSETLPLLRFWSTGDTGGEIYNPNLDTEQPNPPPKKIPPHRHLLCCLVRV